MNPDFEYTEDYTNIKNKILDYLSRQDYSETKLLQKVLLLRKRYPKSKRYENYTKENVQYVLGMFKRLGVLDEKRALHNMLQSSLTGIYGLRRIKEKMYRQLYKKKNIEESIKEFEEFESDRDYSRITGMTNRKKEAIERRYPEADNYQIKEKLFGFLAQKGFEYDEIKKIIDTIYDSQ